MIFPPVFFLRQTLMLVTLLVVTSCGSLWAQYQQRKMEIVTQLASGRISKRTYDQKMADLERWYERGGRSYAGSGRKSSKSASSSGGNTKGETSASSSEPATSTASTPYPRSSDGVNDIARKKKSGISEF